MGLLRLGTDAAADVALLLLPVTSLPSVQCVDYSNQRLPSGYNLVWSRDSLQHIPLHGAWQFLSNVKASGAKYLLVGSYVKSSAPNKNIGAGRQVFLRLPCCFLY